ncbi:MAG: TonB-dependent receptor plug domain-containing protein [Gammaproteobacteria bacterium]|nr:TonB-dependent receptor plug domain-containing protein [Gammaproteobacteria bacterium]MYH84920.1 TonB-dependent receptor plug domain-containing protein [Gammaproteobacteria bacterium]MYK03763.1 TonB-dependent receptor plug domain-containing protein [Gammaproteobacteria bacterium]
MKMHDRLRLLSLALLLVAGRTTAQTAVQEIVVTGDLDSLPGGYVESVFGFDKSLLETPRSASTISSALLERFDMQDIDELIVLAPGSFTQSFFGVAGGLDIRGTPGETYFRGIRRLDNPGNYPTPIGASDRIDIIRGPASPIYGPAKIGGYLNFNPKSARIEETGAILAETSGAVSFSTGSWDKAVVAAEVGGPGRFGSRELGYYLYALSEDSGSYYDESLQQQNLLQLSVDLDVSDSVHAQFGGMWHQYDGTQVAGWNRLTQDLIDHGSYVTGSPSSLDRDGDGHVSHQEFDLDGDGFYDLNPFAAGLIPGQGGQLEGSGVCLIGAVPLFGCFPELLALENPGAGTIAGNQTLTAPGDALENQVTTLYFDLLGGDDAGWEWKNQLFFEHYDNLNENAYGFSQFHDTWVLENKLVFSRRFRFDDLTAALQLSPSLRHTNFEHADDYTNEYFDRRDLSRPLDARARRLLSTRIDGDYTEYYIGEYTDIGLAALLDLTFDNGFSVLAGVRHDSIEVESRQPLDKLLFPSSNNFCPPPGDCAALAAEDDVGGVSWTLSVSRQMDNGLAPYVTASRQSTLIAGQGAEVTTANVRDGTAFDQSELLEAGVKGRLLDSRLYFAAAAYRQERTDFSAQSIVTNQAARTRGIEFETRWSVNESLLLTFGYSRIEVVNLNTLEAGSRFSFVGAEDLPEIEPWRFYGGTLGGDVISGDARRTGMPENIYSLTGTWDFGNGWTVNGSLADVEEVYSGYSRRVLLPAYTLVNLGFGYEASDWLFSFNFKNVTDERYFRANFPNLFGGVIALPELPRHFNASIRYRF